MWKQNKNLNHYKLVDKSDQINNRQKYGKHIKTIIAQLEIS